MRNVLAMTIICVAGIAASMQGLAGAQEAIVLHVAPDGSDAWSGKLAAPNADGSDGPLASVTAARDAIRNMSAEDRGGRPITVHLRGGIYRIAAAVAFGPEDSGAPGAPITYSSYPGERAVLSGGVPVTGWRQEGPLWVADLPGVREGTWNFHAIWVNGAYRHPARTPNGGFFHTAGKPPAETNADTGEAIDRSDIAFCFSPGDIQHWENIDDAILVAMHAWDTSHHRIAAIDDANNVVTFTGKSGWKFENFGPKQRYYVEHIFEGLDEPGEWYLNRATGTLYYYPLDGEAMDTAEVIAPVTSQLVRFDGDLDNGRFVEFIHLKDLGFQHTEFTLGPEGQPTAQAAYFVQGAIHGNGMRSCLIERCEVSNISTYAIWLQRGCRDNRIVHNHAHGLGAGGIRIGDGGDPANEHAVTGWNVADNNWVHDGGLIFPAAVGVWIGRSSYNTVSHNEISDFFYTGVSVGWSWGYQPSSANHNVIEYNHIHDLGKWILSDMGGIYTLGDAPGTILRYNLIHDVFAYSYGGWGIYPDEGSTDLRIENNIVYNTKSGTFHQHYGKENLITNNIFAFSHEGQLQRTREEEHFSFYFRRNIVYFNNGRLLGSNWSNGNYRLDWNCYWDTSGMEFDLAGRDLAEWQAAGQDLNSVVADPLFRDAERFDFTLDPHSPAIEKLGFQPIDTSRIGLYGEDEWVSAPKAIPREPSALPRIELPKPIQDDFESTPVGDPPAGVSVNGETDVARIRVTDEVAASGSKCLKITDDAGLEKNYNPHMCYTPGMRRGIVTARFDIRLEPGSMIYHEWRTGGHPYHVGPSLFFLPGGILKTRDRELMQIPEGEWVDVTIACGMGSASTGAYAVEVHLPGQDPVRFDGLPLGSDRFRRLDWFGFVADADGPGVIYLDNIAVNCAE